jgi:uncharacterized integral membrane protein (TIGR00697 family)
MNNIQNPPTNFRYYDVIACLFVAVLIISNIASAKVSHIGPFDFDGGTVLFPIAYIFDDILTEVYGYAKSRRIIWLGFFCLITFAVTLGVVQYLPPAPGWTDQAAYEAIVGFVPRIVLASMTAYWMGEFLNSFVLAKMKLWTNGKYLWTRTVGSTIAGEAVDTVTFTSIAFLGVLPLAVVLNIMATIYVFKVLYEIIATPLTYKIIHFLKKSEGVDYYDRGTNFTPFRLE